MAKGQKRSNREVKKPKQVKVAAPVAAEGLLAKANTASAPGKKRI